VNLIYLLKINSHQVKQAEQSMKYKVKIAIIVKKVSMQLNTDNDIL